MLIGIFDFAKVQAIIERGRHPVAVMARDGDGSDLEVMAIPMTPEVQADVTARGLECLAIAGILDGAPVIEMPKSLAEDVAFAIGMAHRRYIEAQPANT
ncbi:hypothetical protein [Edaphobacter albus]|uniref:hypothetical protein n=1 Tax=Edaphobacter sp. 4G125 TaxID=2763071 RepID=UPI0016489C5E|nr:hypothetical protein [Edaphobacter sp. 4G125]QNI35454.1 hypothetical protein H7846_10215 [Edaphobacter sp. 4G125]